MKTEGGIELISYQVIEILSSSKYPKTVHNICARLIKQGIISREEQKHYSMLLSKWHREQNNIINLKKFDGKDATRMYILKENARKYWPQFLGGGKK